MMSTLDELKKVWSEKQNDVGTLHDHESLEKIVRSRVKKHTTTSFQYFWASFTLQVIVYSLLSHVIIKYWQHNEIVYLCIAGVFLFLPFTIVLMQKFKSMATNKFPSGENTGASLYDFVLNHQTLLRKFYRFKKWYEFFLTPLSTAIAIIIIFKLYMPGGVYEHRMGAIIIFIISLISCVIAIRSENKKSFQKPIQQLQNVLDDFSKDA